nr:unnamed protein product [Callosobruchus chinensis]
MTDSFDSFTSGLDTKGAEKELQEFLMVEKQKAQFNAQIHEFNDICWDKCVDKPSNKLDSKTETCLSNCVDRFIDVSLLITNRFAQMLQKILKVSKMTDSFDSFTSGLDTKGAEKELQEFLMVEKQKAQFNAQIHEFNDICWDKCVDKPSNKLDSKTETCLSNCVDRFIDVSLLITNRCYRRVEECKLLLLLYFCSESFIQIMTVKLVILFAVFQIVVVCSSPYMHHLMVKRVKYCGPALADIVNLVCSGPTILSVHSKGANVIGANEDTQRDS